MAMPIANSSEDNPPPLQERLSVSLVIPARNDSSSLEYILERLPEIVSELVVVDGHSTDDTIGTVRRIRPDAVVLKQPGRGIGNALAHGVKAATSAYVVIMSAEGEHDAADIPSLVAELQRGADFAAASRYLKGGTEYDEISGARQLSWKLCNRLGSFLFRSKMTDLDCWFAAFRKEVVPIIERSRPVPGSKGPHRREDGAGALVLLHLRAAKAGLRISEVHTAPLDKLHGESNLDGWMQIPRIMWTIIRERFSKSAR